MDIRSVRNCLRVPIYILTGIMLAVYIFSGCTSSGTQQAGNPVQNTTAEAVSTQANTADTGSKTETTESNELFPVYGMDKSSADKEVNFYIAVKKDIPLEEKLKTIAEKSSRFRFSGLPITLLEVKKEDGKKIAVIDLGETQDNKGIADPANIQGDAADTWIFGYFQGSAGGGATVETLVETFLQRQYKGEWIDGVEFRYEGKPIGAMHVEPLSKTIFR